MRKLSRFEKLGVVATVVIASSYLYMKKVYEPQEKKLKTTITQLNKVVGEINSLKATPSASALNRNLKVQKTELAELERRLGVNSGKDRQLGELQSAISRRIEQSGIRVQKLSANGHVKDELFQWNVFELELTGDYFRFVSLMERLRDMPNAIKLQKIRLEQGEKDYLKVSMELLI